MKDVQVIYKLLFSKFISKIAMILKKKNKKDCFGLKVVKVLTFDEINQILENSNMINTCSKQSSRNSSCFRTSQKSKLFCTKSWKKKYQ